ncbi:trace amine-associated receptor 6-like [Lampris incognitus]|uniref:trace amine-associated receptor 6-like n=1 Tax=Lampris incognitus TaxID=2546036 RepID=UPI0024B57756|nr:trace amine-associated receptor 6-like [Lampris incognitus]
MEMLEGADLCFPHLLNASCRKQMRPQSEALLLSILLSFISLLTVALNLLVIISISHFRQLHTPTNLLLLSLAVSDFLVGILLMPVEGFRFLGACWMLGDFLCALFYFVAYVITSASVGNMVLISIDRYVAICDPLHYPTKITQRRVQVCVCLCWVCSVLYNTLMQTDNLNQLSSYYSCYGECVFISHYIAGAVDLVITFTIPIVVIVFLYMSVFIVAVKQARAMSFHITTIKPGVVTITARKSERKAARTLGIVIVVFLICFCPYYYPAFVGVDTELNSLSSSLVVFLFFSNSCANPVIYVFFYPWFRRTIKVIATLEILQTNSCKMNIL